MKIPKLKQEMRSEELEYAGHHEPLKVRRQKKKDKACYHTKSNAPDECA
jgi:hypothetical protein